MYFKSHGGFVFYARSQAVELSENAPATFCCSSCLSHYTLGIAVTMARAPTIRRAYVTCESFLRKQMRSHSILAHSMDSIFRQNNSWDRFRISRIGFSRIFGSNGIYAPFLDFVRAFGVKFGAEDEDFGGFNCRFSMATGARKSYGTSLLFMCAFSFSNVSLVLQELCYNVRYVERHGRKGEYPWSFRQTALYHKWNESTGTSMWILLQPPDVIKRNLARAFGNDNNESSRFHWKTPFFTHMMILLTTEAGWRAFVIELEKQIENQVKIHPLSKELARRLVGTDIGNGRHTLQNEKALFSRVGRPAKYDYSVDFSESQELQVIRQRLLKAQSAIELSLKVARDLQSFCKKLGKDKDGSPNELWLPELETYISRLYTHKHSFRRLLNVTEGTMTLVCNCLNAYCFISFLLSLLESLTWDSYSRF